MAGLPVGVANRQRSFQRYSHQEGSARGEQRLVVEVRDHLVGLRIRPCRPIKPQLGAISLGDRIRATPDDLAAFGVSIVARPFPPLADVSAINHLIRAPRAVRVMIREPGDQRPVQHGVSGFAHTVPPAASRPVQDMESCKRLSDFNAPNQSRVLAPD